MAEEIALVIVNGERYAGAGWTKMLVTDAYEAADALIARRVVTPAVEAGGRPTHVRVTNACPGVRSVRNGGVYEVRSWTEYGPVVVCEDGDDWELTDSKWEPADAPAATVDEKREREAHDALAELRGAHGADTQGRAWNSRWSAAYDRVERALLDALARAKGGGA